MYTQGSFNHMRHNSHALHDFTLPLLRNVRRQSFNHMKWKAILIIRAPRCNHMKRARAR